MPIDARKVQQSWIATERTLGLGALIVLLGFVVLFVPEPSPPAPADLLGGSVRSTCPAVTLKPADLTSPAPDFTHADLRNIDLSGHSFPPKTSFRGADLTGVILNNTKFDEANLTCARLVAAYSDAKTPARFALANLTQARLNEAQLPGATLLAGRLNGADLSGTNLKGADLRNVDFTGAELDGTILSNARLGEAQFDLTDYRPVDAPNAGESVGILNIDRVRLTKPDLTGLRQLAQAFENADEGDMAVKVRATISRWQRHFDRQDPEVSFATHITVWVQTVVFGWIGADGTQPLRPFWLLAIVTLLFAAVYWASLARSPVADRKVVHTIMVDRSRVGRPIPGGSWHMVAPSVMLSLSSAALIARPVFSVLDLATQAIGPLPGYRPTGWVKGATIIQALVTLGLLLTWVIG